MSTSIAMEVLAAPMEASDIAELVSYFPDFKGSLPPEACYWKRSDLELYLGSNGQLRPKERTGSCAFLSRARQRLAELKVSEATNEQRVGIEVERGRWGTVDIGALLERSFKMALKGFQMDFR